MAWIELSFRGLRLELARTAEKWFEHTIKKWIILHGAPMEEVRTVRNRFVALHRRFSDVEVTTDSVDQRAVTLQLMYWLAGCCTNQDV